MGCNECFVYKHEKGPFKADGLIDIAAVKHKVLGLHTGKKKTHSANYKEFLVSEQSSKHGGNRRVLVLLLVLWACIRIKIHTHFYKTTPYVPFWFPVFILLESSLQIFISRFLSVANSKHHSEPGLLKRKTRLWDHDLKRWKQNATDVQKNVSSSEQNFVLRSKCDYNIDKYVLESFLFPGWRCFQLEFLLEHLAFIPL